MKIVLSRKGFDSSRNSGGHPSPILPDGKMLSVPIPGRWETLTYNDIAAPGGKTYAEILEELGAGVEMGRELVHLDPDLMPGALRRPPNWLPAFGQANAAQSHLENRGVSRGDLFLFFGWFRHTEEADERLRFCGDANGFHAIFGYLQIGDILCASGAAQLPTWLNGHPHADEAAMKRKTNTIYVSTEKLSFHQRYPGAGVFEFDDRKMLTQKGELRSRWNLDPEIFRNVNISYHSESSWKDGYFQSAGRGQEFVVHADEKVIEWAFSLIKGARLWQQQLIRIIGLSLCN